VPDSQDADVEVAARLEREAQRVIDDGAGSSALKLAVDQLRADRTNGEKLDDAIDRLRRALDRAVPTGSGDE
jgi:hypothetical protein